MSENEKRKVYFIPGLGADRRVFSLLDLSYCEPVFLDWIKPVKKESLAQYALRFREEIPEQHPLVVGISMGGMMATEMAKKDPQLRAIIISSNKTSQEFPSYLRIGRYVPVYKWMPENFARHVMRISSRFMGGHKKNEQLLLDEIIRDTDHQFVNWAIGAILRWHNVEVPSNLIHIHGTADRVLPYKKVSAHHTIDGGTHVMTIDQPEAVSNMLKMLIFEELLSKSAQSNNLEQ